MRLALIFILISFLVIGWLVKRSHPVVAPIVKNIWMTTKILLNGEKNYIEEQMKPEYATGASTSGKDARIIETSVLPLQLRSIWLGASGTFPSGAGALTVAEGQLLILDRFGGIYVFRDEKLERLNYGEFPNRLREYLLNSKNPSLNSAFMRAYSIAYDKTASRIYVGYTKFVNSEANRFAISAIPVNKVTLEATGKWETIFESQNFSSKLPSHGGGGKILINKNKLYFSIGYYNVDGFPGENLINGKLVLPAQDNKSQSGKIFEIDLQTKIAKMKSWGHRNVQGLTMTESGSLLATEHGPQGGDEVNLIEDGQNYGWPFQSHGTRYGTYDFDWPEGSVPDNQRIIDPVYAFVPSIGISPIHSIVNFHKRWEGDLLVGSLKAQSLFRLKFKDGRIIFSEPIWIGHRIRDMAEMQQKIVLLTDDSYLIVLTVEGDLLKKNSKNAGYNFKPKINRCLMCHHFEQSTPSSLAPSLSNILDRKIATDSFTKYSDALRSKSGKWDRENLTRYIANPASFAPGTTMPSLGLSQSEVKEIVEIISQ